MFIGLCGDEDGFAADGSDDVWRVGDFQQCAGGAMREGRGGEGWEWGGVEGDGDCGVGGEAVFVGGEEEGTKGAPSLTRLEREESVQDLRVSPHPILKLLQKHNVIQSHTPRCWVYLNSTLNLHYKCRTLLPYIEILVHNIH